MGGGSSIPSVLDEELDSNKIMMLENRCKLLEEELLEKSRELHARNEKQASLAQSSESTVAKKDTSDDGVIDTYRLRLLKVKETDQNTFIELPRGGIYLKTKSAAIQFGIPPETIKDSMNLGLKVPTFFVVPPERFHLRLGINLAELEFPAYFNFFLLQSKVHIILTEEQEKAIKSSFTETIEGPLKENLYVDEDYGPKPSQDSVDAKPDLLKEIAFFKEPRNGRVINCNSLVSFHVFDDNNEVKLEMESSNFTIKSDLSKSTFIVSETIGTDNTEYRVSYEQANFVPTPEIFEKLHSKYKKLLTKEEQELYGLENESKTKPSSSIVSDESGSLFVPPNYGITFLGTSHGFDSNGVTTGFIIWIHGKGIYVDPPPHADSYLLSNGVSPRKIQKIILTHCHADHDAGTFQKLLRERKLCLITTKTIYSQFVRKYAAISGITEKMLLSLISFEQIYIDFSHVIYGAKFTFFYSLHALPCIGFISELDDKSFSYSGDTFYDKEGLQRLKEAGILSKARKEALCNFPWNCSLVLHECGVPPIHTPIEALTSLSQEIKQKLFVVHMAEKAAEAAQLKTPPLGFTNTIALDVRNKPHSDAIKIIRLLSDIFFFKEINLFSACLLLEVGKTAKYSKGQNFSGVVKGTFLIVLEGILLVSRKKGKKRYLQMGDYFGELSCFTFSGDDITLNAITPVRIYQLDSFGLHQIMHNCSHLKQNLESMLKLKANKETKTLHLNSLFQELNFQQRNELQMTILCMKTIKKSESIKLCGNPLFILKGQCQLTELIEGKLVETITLNEKSLFVADSVRTFLLGSTINTESSSLCATSDICKFLVLDLKKFQDFSENNPYVKLAILKCNGIIV